LRVGGVRVLKDYIERYSRAEDYPAGDWRTIVEMSELRALALSVFARRQAAEELAPPPSGTGAGAVPTIVANDAHEEDPSNRCGPGCLGGLFRWVAGG
jgi:aminoglycoside phosphotransferase (APT) family kinase protein